MPADSNLSSKSLSLTFLLSSFISFLLADYKTITHVKGQEQHVSSFSSKIVDTTIVGGTSKPYLP